MNYDPHEKPPHPFWRAAGKFVAIALFSFMWLTILAGMIVAVVVVVSWAYEIGGPIAGLAVVFGLIAVAIAAVRMEDSDTPI